MAIGGLLPPTPPFFLLPSGRHDGGGDPAAAAAAARPEGSEVAGSRVVLRSPGREGGGERRRAAPSGPAPSGPAPRRGAGPLLAVSAEGAEPGPLLAVFPEGAEPAPLLAVSPEGAEPRLAELGLGGAGPVGLIQSALEALHADLGLPWWGAIAAGTVGARVLLLPLVLRGQREAARLARHLPTLQRAALRADAKRGTDPNRVAVAYSELVSYQRQHNVNPLRGFLVPLVQTPLFVSFFLALQGMAAAPVPGLLQGGLGWFPNLAAPDPFYILPVLVTASTWLVLELGAETGVSAPGAGPVRQILRLLPLVFLPFIIHFPTAIFTYWLTSNSFSLLQTGLLRVPALRARLGVAPPPAPPPATPTGPAPKSKGGILRQLRKEWREAQATHEAEQRRWRLRNHLTLAAKGPLRQTFAQNPLNPKMAPSEPPKRPWKDTLG
ncbi:LOW QUALITY PROTEIN: mitochondrial inner membrane protein OXA1L [Camarhynchus parvulus]|uniref:LOW QUALITY PROTEIN: mitochondrial inner membrane protein OXA1L n=1 Tax=Geospiza parvula TaxID=87175 RepID=UPI001237A4E7|nr:LOW QUALITY PROTEIN: mitochondrial inner membrane protein OXA1L [Camarhynchus parvulus]